MRRWRLVAAVIAGLVAAGPMRADDAPRASALARMPVKEITVFKDGHAFVVHEGRMAIDASGAVQMDYLPTPVLGTFWPYCTDKVLKLSAVTASPRRVLIDQTALTTKELIEANTGADVTLIDAYGKGHTGRILAVPTRSADELAATGPPNSPEKLPEKGSIVLLKTKDGVETLQLDQIRQATFRGQYRAQASHEEFRNLLTLRLAWPNGQAAKNADVGLMYVQKGVRWIPGYKVALDGKGTATVTLQATLLNEMTDLSDVTANLVVGVPSFAFKDTTDPMALQQTLGQLSQYFATDTRTNYAFSNAIMGQSARASEFRAPQAPPPPDLGPEVGGSERSEDLYVYTVRHVSLKKGQRMVLPIAEYTLKYSDVYTLNVPVGPPAEVRGRLNSEQQAEIARLMAAPKVMHVVRLVNDSKQPLTTAPALIVTGDRPLGQGMMTYASPGGTTDLPITTAIDVRPKVVDKETGRTPNVTKWQDTFYGRVDMAGTITLTNFRAEPVEVEVNRYILGHVDKADHDGQAAMLNPWSDDALSAQQPTWWNWYSWPAWWSALNGVGRFTWKLRVEPGKSIDVNDAWHYFWG